MEFDQIYSLLDDLANDSKWIYFGPPRPYNPNAGIYPTEDELRASLCRLRAEGWCNLVTVALLGSDPDVARLRLRIGAEFVARFEAALGEVDDPLVLEALTFAFSGALLQAGMGLVTYADLGDRLDGVVAAILEGHTR